MAELNVNKVRHVAAAPLGSATAIGRSSANDVVLRHGTVSRRHCLIEVVEGVARLRDLGSTYGTTVNGARVSEAVLHDGDMIGVGPFQIRYADPESSGSLPAITTEVLEAELERAQSEAQDEHRHSEALEAELSEQRRALEAELGEQRRALDEQIDSLLAERAALGPIEEALRRLREAAHRLSVLHENVRALEALWIETNEWAEEAVQRDVGSVARAVHERDSVGAQLEAAHGERDAAIESLQALVNGHKR